jgi:ankyrin repeat protein
MHSPGSAHKRNLANTHAQPHDAPGVILLPLAVRSHHCRVCGKFPLLSDKTGAVTVRKVVALFRLLPLLMLMLTGALPAAAQTPDLVVAAEAGDVARVRTLLAGGATVDVRDGRGRTPLLAATHANQVAVAAALIAAGADVNAKDAIADSPFLYAGAEGRLDILKLTLTHGADLRSVNRFGGTALIPAAHHGHVETVRTLLQTGIDIDHVNRLGWTALLEAVVLGDGGPAHAEIVRLLVAHGARTDIADHAGVTPLRHAEQRGQTAVVEILKGAGAR